MPIDPARVKTLFLEASDLASQAERVAFLDCECGGDAELRARVEALLAVQDRAGPVPNADATGVFDPTAAETIAGTQIVTSETRAGSRAPNALARHDETEATGIDGQSATLDAPATVSRETRGSGFVPGHMIAGRYTLRAILGEGGMGTVYQADQTEPVKRQVALKLIKIGMDTRTVLARFNAERQALALMDHPNIARVFDGGTTDTCQPFFVMELVQGVPITDHCDQKGLSVKARLELFVAVCHAVQHAHQKGIIHRDLKPSNVMVTEVDGRPTPKVIDFGVAKATEFDLTDHSVGDTGAIVGTPTYMSPEQADPSTVDIDTRTDVYALGVILYELLAGSPPLDPSQFKRGAILEMLRMVREVDPPRPSTRVSTALGLPNIAASRGIDPAQLKRALTGDLDWIVMKAIEKDRARRYDTANGFAADIVRHLSLEPVLAAPPSRVYRMRKFVRKNRGVVIAASLVLFALIFGFLGTTWGLIQAARANTALATKNVELADEQAKVEQRFELAQKAIGTFHTGVSEDMLMKNSQFQQLRTKLLREAAGFYGDLEKLLEGQTDTKSRKLLAAGYYQLGDLTNKIGESPKALAVLLKALEVRRVLAATGADRETRLNVARTLGAIGDLLMSTGDSDGALRAFEEQREIAMALEKESSMDDVLPVLARSYSSIGGNLNETAKFATAREAFRKAAAIRQKLANANPTDPKYQLDLAISYADLGAELHMTLAEFEEAVTFNEKSVEILKKLVDDHPGVTEFQYSLAAAYNNVGWAKYEMLWRPTEAMTALNNSLALYRKLAETYSAVNVYQSDLADLYNSIGTLLQILGKWPQALESCQNALAASRKLVESNPGNVLDRRNHALNFQLAGRMLREMGRESEAMEALQHALAMQQSVVEVDPALYDSARYLCWIYEDIGELLEGIGKPAEAMKAYSEANAIGRKYAETHPTDLLIQRVLGWIHSHFGMLQRDTG